MSFGEWSIEPLQVAPILLLALLYAQRARTLATRGRPVTHRRQVCFYSGLLVGLVSLVSPIDWLGENRFLWMHMIQHLLLGDIAPLLVVLGLTGAILRPLLAIRVIRPARVLLHPLVSLPLWIITWSVWHIPFMYEAALANDNVHALEHTCFAVFGALMWGSVLEPLPGPAWFGNGMKALYTLVPRAAGLVLSQIFLWNPHVMYANYIPLDRVAHIAPLTDQRLAGLAMFIEGGVVSVIVFSWLFLRMYRETELSQRLIERGVAPAAAARAARYERTAIAREAARSMAQGSGLSDHDSHPAPAPPQLRQS